MNLFYPFEFFAQLVAYSRLGITIESHLGGAIEFFIYDTLKIFVMLLVITQIMSLVTILFPIQKIQVFLANNKLFGLEYFFASLFGALTPFCSCSSIPLFIGLLKGGIPLGVTFSFLITSPLVNEVAIALFLGMFGLKTTLMYVAGGVFLGMLGGWILGKLRLEGEVADFVRNIQAQSGTIHEEKKTFLQIRQTSTHEGRDITKKVFPYVVFGVAIGAVIHGFVPVGFFAGYIGKDNRFAVPIAVVFGVPMYANATSILPIIQSLIVKGVPIGTGLAFMMATVGLSIPEFLILKKVMSIKLLVLFFGIVSVCIILLGYVYNVVL